MMCLFNFKVTFKTFTAEFWGMPDLEGLRLAL